MATADKLEYDGDLILVWVPLPPHKSNLRRFYACPELFDWIRDELPNLAPGRLQSSETPRQQLDFKLFQWNSGATFHYQKWLFDLVPKQDEVWEFKTADLRIFGWLYKPRVFVGVFGDYADLYKGRGRSRSYDNAVRVVKARRDKIPLDEPKFATGTFDDLVLV